MTGPEFPEMYTVLMQSFISINFSEQIRAKNVTSIAGVHFLNPTIEKNDTEITETGLITGRTIQSSNIITINTQSTTGIRSRINASWVLIQQLNNNGFLRFIDHITGKRFYVLFPRMEKIFIENSEYPQNDIQHGTHNYSRLMNSINIQVVPDATVIDI